MDLKADKDRADQRYKAARQIGKLLAELERDDVLPVVRHVAVEYGLRVDMDVKGPAVAATLTDPKAGTPTPPKAA